MKRREMKILFSSNAPWSRSGYGNWVKDFTRRALKDSWNLRLVSWAGLGGGAVEYEGAYCYPQTESAWGEDALFFHGNSWGANVRFSMQDVHAMNPQWLQQMNNWIPYVPIDRDEVQPQVLEALKYAYKIITFSKFGQKALEHFGYASTMIPEGVDTSILKPLDKLQARKDLNFPTDKIIIGQIGANKPDGVPRKGWQQSIEAFKLFTEKYPNSIFYWNSNQVGGFDIQGYANFLGIGDKIATTDPYSIIYNTTDELRTKLYNSFDLLIHPSTTEGFGLTPVEAQACGIPVVVNNCHSQPELVNEGRTGEICDTAFKLWSNGYVHFADSKDLADKMIKVYERTKANPNKTINDCRAWVKQNYDIDTIYKERWVPYLEALQDELLPITEEKR